MYTATILPIDVIMWQMCMEKAFNKGFFGVFV